MDVHEKRTPVCVRYFYGLWRESSINLPIANPELEQVVHEMIYAICNDLRVEICSLNYKR